MRAKPIIFAAFGLSALTASAQSVTVEGNLPKFMGREITISEPERDAEGFPKGPASVCVQGPPQRQCYTAPKDFGNSPKVTVVQLKKGVPALFFSAASGGVSGWAVHFALLRPDMGNELEDMFALDTTVSNQSQHAFWSDLAISDAQIFVTADYVPELSHYGEHRYMVSSYIWRPPLMFDDVLYILDDRYMTARRYDLGSGADILASEKQEVLARLRRAKAAAEPR
jgi:hypothetical protein